MVQHAPKAATQSSLATALCSQGFIIHFFKQLLQHTDVHNALNIFPAILFNYLTGTERHAGANVREDVPGNAQVSQGLDGAAQPCPL